ncbi:MAG: phenylalanine--tRNA ligase subunit beta [Pseudomonadota bacterium]|nr:phenylalanine--tRNA ligase subunit beta [Pseudomonadota bacterium]
MKLSFSWLKEQLLTTATPKEIAHQLTMIGLEVESLIDPTESLKDFVVARVERVDSHPNADRLKICSVNNGSEVFQVICGAPNVYAGMNGVFAGVGTFIPGTKLKLKKSKIRGITSNGMLLSELEMGLSEDHEGIIELEKALTAGTPALQAMKLDDPIFEIAITPNRGDCLGVRGVARDLAATGIGTLKPLEIEPIPGKFKSPIKVNLDLTEEMSDACPYFVGRYFKNVKNVDSPSWLKQRLQSIGLRPISALVDITNFFTFAFGRPLHVFDAEKLQGDIEVRLSHSDELLKALDGKEYKLDDQMTVIADQIHAEGLAGVMGGEKTGCTEDTTNVFLEAAYFDPVRTAMTGRKLNLQSDARFRFERGIDPEFQIPAVELATKLIVEICGGEASDIIIAGTKPALARTYHLREARVLELGGIKIGSKDIEQILRSLGFMLEKSDNGWQCDVPPWRHDIQGEADLIEEVIRIHGFDRIDPISLGNINILRAGGAINLPQERRVTTRRFLAFSGMTELVTFSFIPSKYAKYFGDAPNTIKLVNPISSDLDIMRPSLFPNLLVAAKKNADRGINDCSLFEVGPQYHGENIKDQRIIAAGIRCGKYAERHWASPTKEFDIFDVKADAIGVLSELEISIKRAQLRPDAPPWYHPGRSGIYQLGPQLTIANFGELHPRLLNEMGLEGRIYGFEIFLDKLPLPKFGKGNTRPTLILSPYQTVERDFSFIMDENILADDLVSAAEAADQNLISKVFVFDVFAGDPIGSGKKSIAITAVMEPRENTLTEKVIEETSKKIISNVLKKTGAILRS